MNISCVETEKCLDVAADGTYSNHSTLRSWNQFITLNPKFIFIYLN